MGANPGVALASQELASQQSALPKAVERGSKDSPSSTHSSQDSLPIVLATVSQVDRESKWWSSEEYLVPPTFSIFISWLFFYLVDALQIKLADFKEVKKEKSTAQHQSRHRKKKIDRTTMM